MCECLFPLKFTLKILSTKGNGVRGGLRDSSLPCAWPCPVLAPWGLWQLTGGPSPASRTLRNKFLVLCISHWSVVFSYSSHSQLREEGTSTKWLPPWPGADLGDHRSLGWQAEQ